MLVPLCVDLDGTLIKTNSLLESFLILIKKNPLCCFVAIGWLLQGIAHLKQEIANRVLLDPAIFPYTSNFLNYLKEEYANGRTLILVTAANKQIAENVANYLGIFSQVLASDENINLKGENKKKILCQMLGEKKYDYAGNDKNDLKVWASARQGIVVNANTHVLQKACQLTDVDKIFFREKNQFFAFLKAIRIYQYVKNILVFVPLLVSHKFFEF